MVYKVIIHKKVLIDADYLPTGFEEDLSVEECDEIWEAIEGENVIQIDEEIEEVE